jgi:acetyl-CoA C-acetyltransferase
MTNVWILGGAQTDFARNYAREGLDISALFADVIGASLTAAAVGPSDIDTIHVGNAFGQLFTGQGHLGAMPATVEPALSGVPAARHEAACASGSVAVLSAMAELEAGRYDCALVIGAELEKAVGGDQAARLMGAAGWVGHEAEDTAYMWPWAFDSVAAEYEHRYGLDPAHLQALGHKAFENATRNPHAQTRDWKIQSQMFTDETANPAVHGKVRRLDCSQITDGAAAVVLANDRFLRRTGRAGASFIAGWGHTTVGLPLNPKLRESRAEAFVMPHVRTAITDAFRRAKIADVWSLDGIETHDCFTPSEYLAIDHFGITEPGKQGQAIESGVVELGGTMPINPSGGLIGGGHPVGATGVRMLLDAHRQVTGTASEYQVPDARLFATLNIGGSTATSVSFVVGAAD